MCEESYVLWVLGIWTNNSQFWFLGCGLSFDFYFVLVFFFSSFLIMFLFITILGFPLSYGEVGEIGFSSIKFNSFFSPNCLNLFH